MTASWTTKAEGGGTGRAPDLAEVRQALSLLVDPASTVELFSLFPARYSWLAGNDPEGLTAEVGNSQGSNGNFVALNPLPADFLGQPGTGAHVPDFSCRRWLPLDVDPVKPSKTVNATDAEHTAAADVMSAATAFLSGKGAPDPLVIDTGGGWLALYRIDLLNDDESRKLVARLLKDLAGAFDTPSATIDSGSSRVTFHARLPGTWNRKGPHEADRPQRMVRLARIPAALSVLPRALLEELAGPVPESQPRKPFRTTATGSDREKNYARAALEGECAAVAAERDLRNNRLNDAAVKLGHYVGAGLLAREEVERRLEEAACECGLDTDTGGIRGIRATIKSGLDAGEKEPRGMPEDGPVPASTSNGHASHEPATPAGKKPEQPPPEIYTLPQLLAMDLPPPSWAVPGLLSEGLTILAGKPKLGKSWLALNLALTLAAGGMALGNTPVDPGDVLYISLEDRLRRVQDRARKVLKGLHLEASARLSVAVEWPRQDQGGLAQIEKWLDGVKRPMLVIIDVWAKLRPVSLSSRSAYDQDVQHISQLKSVIDEAKTSALLIMHCKKAKGEDVVDEVSGTLGLAGSTDGTLVLTRARSEFEAELFVTGRDVEEAKLALLFDPLSFTWKLTGTAAEATESKIKTGALEILKSNTGQAISTAEIADRLDLPKDRHHYLRNVLGRMAEAGIIERVGNGRWLYPVRGSEGAF